MEPSSYASDSGPAKRSGLLHIEAGLVHSPKAHHDVQAFAAFRSNVHSRAEKRGKAIRAAVRFSRVTQSAAMAGWREHAARRAAMRRTAQKALAALRNRLAAAALRSWRQTVAELADRRQQARTV